MSNQKQFNYIQPLIYAVVLMMGMVLGFRLYSSLNGKPKLDSVFSRNLNAAGASQLGDIIGFIENNYVDSVNTSLLVDEAIEEILSELDPHSTYISPEEVEEVNESMKGNFEGIGIEFFILDDTITVISPIANGPSEKVGIKSGDKIIEIEDSIVAGIGIKNKDVLSKLKGKRGTTVRVGVLDIDTKEIVPYEIKRGKIKLNSIDIAYMLNSNVGYLKINRFSRTTYNEFIDQLVNLEKQGMQDLILDLRSNPGGILEAATNIVDEFIGDKKLIVYTEGRTYKRNDYKARRSGRFENGKVVVLIDQDSASASEILAGALQDWDRGLIVGRRSFGKGLVQQQYGLSNGGALRLTVARYFTPVGRSIQKAYETGEHDSYNNEVYNRIESGEFFAEDSIKNVDSLMYKTPSGKIVYGGGGITPDIFLPLDTMLRNKDLIQIVNKVPAFSYSFYGGNKNILNAYSDYDEFRRQFSITENIIIDFKSYLNKEKITFSESVFNQNKSMLKTRIKAYLAKQIWRDNGFYPILHSQDKMLEKALQVIEDPEFFSMK